MRNCGLCGVHTGYSMRERELCVFTNRHTRLVRNPRLLRRSSPRIAASSWTAESLHSSGTCLTAQMARRHSTVLLRGNSVCRDKQDGISSGLSNEQSRQSSQRTTHTAWFEHIEHIEAGGTHNGSRNQRRRSHQRCNSHLVKVRESRSQTATSSPRIHRHQLPSYHSAAQISPAQPASRRIGIIRV